MTRNRNVADVQSNGISAVPPSTAGKNAVINGGFDIWQRGTSIAMTSTSYTADRWQGYRGVSGSTVSRQATSDTTNLPNIQYCARVQRDSGNTSTSTIWFSQALESVNSIPFAGKVTTFSFYARSGANYSAASSALNVRLRWGTGTDQNPLGTWTGGGFTVSTTATLTTTWQRFTFTGTVDATATELAAYVGYDGVGTAGAADYFEITGVQLEAGSTATPFSRNGGTIQGETAACQRYYWRNSGALYNPMGPTGYTTQATAANGYMILPTTMRVTPTSIDFANMTWRQINGNGYTVTGLTISSTATNKVIRVDVLASGGGMALNIWGFLETDGYNNGVFGISAEL